MGCEKSKTVPEVEERTAAVGGRGMPVADPAPGGGLFSELQTDIIRSTWPLVAGDMEQSGQAVFVDIFATEPSIKRLFPYSHLSGEKLLNHEPFRNHSRQFMETLNAVCDDLSNLHNDCAVSQRLMVLGAQHATIPGYDVTYFSIFTKCLHMTWERMLGEEYTEEVKDAWSIVFEYVMERIHDGYVLFQQQENNMAAGQTTTVGSSANAVTVD